MADLASLVARLEAVTSKLESGGGGGGGGAVDDGEEAPFVAAFTDLMPYVNTFVECGTKIGGKVAEQCALVDQCFKAQQAFLAMASKSKKPADWPGSAEILAPMAEPLGAVANLEDYGAQKNGTKFVSEAIQAAAWVCIEPTPGPHVKDTLESAMFYGNKVMMDAKNASPKDENAIAWVTSWKEFCPELIKYIKQYHTTGVTWNPKGVDAGSAPAAAAAAPASAAGGKGGGKGKAPPPPPPDLSTLEDKRGGQKGPDAGALFAELNKGGAVTAGLKKVEKKNKTATGDAALVKAVVKKSKIPPKFLKKDGTQRPSKKALEGAKWAVEYFFDERNNGMIEIEGSTVKETLNIYRCHNTVVVVKGKINAVLIDDCSRVSVVCNSDVVSSVDVVNCQSIELQAEAKVPTVLVDKVDGMQLYLGKEALDVTVISSKISEMNVSTPGATEDDDLVEQALPEQFSNSYDAATKTWVTTPVTHG